MRSSTRVVYNAASLISVRLLGNLLSLITLPLYVSVYGDEKYGVFVLAQATIQSLLFFDFGVGSGLTKYTAEFSVDRDTSKLGVAISGSVLLTGVIAVLFALGIYGASFYVDSIFEVQDPDTARQVFQIAAFYTVTLTMVRLSQYILEGFQLHYTVNVFRTIGIVGFLGLYFVVRIWRIDFVLFVKAFLAVEVLVLVLCTVELLRRRLLRGVVVRLNAAVMKTVAKSDFARFSTTVFLTQLIAFFYALSDRYVVGAILTTSMVTVYVIITKPMFIVRMVSNQSLVVVNPLIAAEHRRDNAAFLADVVHRGCAIHAALVLPMVAAVVVLIKPFLDVWIGGEYPRYALWGAIAAAGYLFVPLYSVIVRVLTQTGHEKTVRNITFWTTISNLVVSIVGTYLYGIGGVIVGSIVQIALSAPIYLMRYSKISGLPVHQLIPRDVYMNVVYVVVAACAAFYVQRRLAITIDNWGDFALFGSITCLAMTPYSAFVFIRRGILKAILRSSAG